MLMIKTTEDCLTALMQQIETMHPYELPEIIAVPIVRGSAPYLNWIHECVTKDQ
jgi:periplasmic divalent cation tolerance protein